MDNRRFKCFISYSHKDKAMCEKFKSHLEALKRLFTIEEWYDLMIPAGGKIDEEIAKKVLSADIIFLLISPSFIASDYCYNKELKVAIDRHTQGKCIVVPVICRKFVQGKYPFSGLKYVPTDGKSIDSFKPQNDGFVDALTGIKNLLTSYLNAKSGPVYKLGTAPTEKVKMVEIKVPVVRRAKKMTDKLTQEMVDNLIEYADNLPQFISKVAETTQHQIQSLASIKPAKTPKDTIITCGKSNLEAYLMQIASYVQNCFVGTENTYAHFRFKKEKEYISVANLGYPIIKLQRMPISAEGSMIECAKLNCMPVIKSYNNTLHENTHATEKVRRDYITFAFNEISNKYNVDLSFCVSIVGKNNYREKLVPLALIQVGKHIEYYLSDYFSSCMRLNSNYSLKEILESEALS